MPENLVLQNSMPENLMFHNSMPKKYLVTESLMTNSRALLPYLLLPLHKHHIGGAFVLNCLLFSSVAICFYFILINAIGSVKENDHLEALHLR